jgi:hypothetical protein
MSQPQLGRAGPQAGLANGISGRRRQVFCALSCSESSFTTGGRSTDKEAGRVATVVENEFESTLTVDAALKGVV